MRRLRPLATLGLLLAAVGLAAYLALQGPGARREAERPVRFGPVALDPTHAERLVLWDYPWPHPHPPGDPGRFDGQPADTYERRLQQALAAFRRRYPRIEVEYRLLDFATGPAEVAEALRRGEGPDVLAVWWHGPAPAPELLVPVTPYLDDAARARFHPTALALARHGGQEWVVPRWVAVHAWLWPADADPGPERAPTVGQVAAAQGRGPGFVTLGTHPWLLGELLAGLPVDVTPADRAEALASALRALRAAAGPDPARATVLAPVRTLLQGRWRVAGGLGPPLLRRLASVPQGSGAPAAGAAGGALPGAVPRLLPGQPEGVPLSLGGYAVLRGARPDLRRAQAAMELALHLAAWQPLEATARFLALPAAQTALLRWQHDADLPEAWRARLREVLAAAGEEPRTYRPEGALLPAHPDHARLRDAWQAFWSGDDAALDALLQLLAAPAP